MAATKKPKTDKPSGRIVPCPVRKRKKAKQPVVYNTAKAEAIQLSCNGATGTDSEWDVETKIRWVEDFQTKGVDDNGKSERLYIHLDGVETADITTGEIIPPPLASE